MQFAGFGPHRASVHYDLVDIDLVFRIHFIGKLRTLSVISEPVLVVVMILRGRHHEITRSGPNRSRTRARTAIRTIQNLLLAIRTAIRVPHQHRIARLTNVAEIRVWVWSVWESGFPGTAGRKKFTLLGVSPLHPSVLEPNLDLDRRNKKPKNRTL